LALERSRMTNFINIFQEQLDNICSMWMSKSLFFLLFLLIIFGSISLGKHSTLYRVMKYLFQFTISSVIAKCSIEHMLWDFQGNTL
jgi:amino acid permease